MAKSSTWSFSTKMEQELKVITYNVHSCVGSDSVYSIDRISRTLANQNPDIVCLQEIEDNSGDERGKVPIRLWSTTHRSHQPQEIAAHLNMDYCAFAPAVKSRVVPRTTCLPSKLLPLTEEHDGPYGGYFGNAILSKHKILQTEHYAFRRFKRKTCRNAVACFLELPGNITMWVVTTHLGVHPTGEEQYQQAKELFEFLTYLENLPLDHHHRNSTATNGSSAGIILCGDLNSLPWFRSIQTLKSKMVDAWEINHTNRHDKGHTFPAAGLPLLCCRYLPSFFRLDYIFYKSSSITISSMTDHGDQDEDNSRLICPTTYPTNSSIEIQQIYVLRKGTGADIMGSDHLALCAIFGVHTPQEDTL
mmetsp:Transcript_30217/g.46344  ORF Transcript_30217/g.46344 Transcript_30217/m.46344 type:complete len:361 (+) Transcript_30217:17-1099(+)